MAGRHWGWSVIVAIGVFGAWVPAARAGQLSALVSPGALAKAHASLDGVTNCQACHEAGRRVTVQKCLTCHQPIAQRIAQKTGVHRAAGTDCVTCHVEHAGKDAELRRMDTKTFNHTTDTRFPLDGMHAKVATTCTSCHKQRSFLAAQTTCASCHADPHKGSLGTACVTCHSTTVAFKDAAKGFDHSKTRFALTGSHQQVACAKCHVDGKFKGLAFDTCASCHQSPHRTAIGPTCTSCHTTTAWDTKSIVHDRTRFPLQGAHAKVACEKCHTSGDMARPIAFGQCSTCHANVHGPSITEDCKTCHVETAFHVEGPTGPAATFDHATRTGFALEGKHAALTCRQCHTTLSPSGTPLPQQHVDFRGAKTACASCHADPHKGDNGVTCQACHRTTTFDVKSFVHPKQPAFYAGQHAQVTCVGCHVPAGRLRPVRSGSTLIAFAPATPTMECRTCHNDVHVGQLGGTCESCHDVGGAKFAPVGFSHSRTMFQLAGRHALLDCVSCHAEQTAQFPSGTGKARRYAPMASTCQTCHQDPHLGQFSETCEACHGAATFTMASFSHKGMDDFFGGSHGALTCQACHKRETGAFPVGRGTAVRYRIERTCASCHTGF